VMTLPFCAVSNTIALMMSKRTIILAPTTKQRRIPEHSRKAAVIAYIVEYSGE
jgi:hypothetical protein